MHLLIDSDLHNSPRLLPFDQLLDLVYAVGQYGV